MQVRSLVYKLSGSLSYSTLFPCVRLAVFCGRGRLAVHGRVCEVKTQTRDQDVDVVVDVIVIVRRCWSNKVLCV